MKEEAVNQMSRLQLRTAAKAYGIKYGKLSLMQIREALIEAGDVPIVKKKQKDNGPRAGSKVEKCLELYREHPKASRQELIGIFIKEGKLTSPAAASTYLYNIQQKYK